MRFAIAISFFGFFVLLPLEVLCSPVDSLYNLKPDTLAAKSLLSYGRDFLKKDPNHAMLALNYALQKASALPKLRSEILNNKAIAYYYLNEVDSCLLSFHSAMNLVKETHPVAAAEIAANIATIYISKGRYSDAISKLESLLPILDNYAKPKANLHKSLADAYIKIGANQQALENINLAIEILQEKNETAMLASYYNTKGNILKNLLQTDTALEAYQSALEFYKKASDSLGQAYALNNIGLIYEQKMLYPQAESAYINSLQISNNISEKQLISAIKLNLASLAERRKQTLLAINLFEEVYTFKNENNIVNGLEVVMSRLIDLYLDDDKPQKAFKTAQKLLSFAESSENLYALMYAYEKLALCEAKFKNFQNAYHYQIKFKQISDSILNKDKLMEAGKIEGKFQTLQVIEASKREQARIQAEKEAAIQRKNTLSLRLTSIFIIAMFMILLSFATRINVKTVEYYSLFLLLIWFEYIFILLEPYIDGVSNGNQLYKLLLNIATAIVLLPTERLFQYLLLGMGRKKAAYETA